MKVFVRNGRDIVELHVPVSACVAALKVAYIESGKLEGSPDFIALSHRGTTLRDEDGLLDANVKAGATVHHVTHGIPSYAAVDYAAIAARYAGESRKRTGGQDPRDFPEDWDTRWEKGDEWLTYPPVIVGGRGRAGAGEGGGGSSDAPDERLATRGNESLASRGDESLAREGGDEPLATRAQHAITLSPKLGPVPIPPDHSRAFRSEYVTKIGRATFRIIHRMEGRWNGEAQLMGTGTSGDHPDVRVCSVTLTFNNEKEHWDQRTALTARGGATSAQTLVFKPLSSGILRAESEERVLSHLDMQVQEVDDNILLLTAISKKTGKTLVVETITLIDDLRRVRTVQRFDEKGSFNSVIIFREQRVIDSISGAVQPFRL